MAELTGKMIAFVAEYLKDFNGTQAAIRAGYSENTARSIASENLTKPDIQAEIEKQMKDVIGDRNKIIYENVLYWRDLRNDPESRESDKLKASEYLGKYGGMFIDKIELNANINPDATFEIIKTNADS